MKDGYRYFMARPTAEDGMPELGSEPMYFRVIIAGASITYNVPYFWDGDGWKPSVLTNFISYLDDSLRSGATVRELLNEKELPRA